MTRTGRALGMAMFAGLCAVWIADAAEQKTLECTPRLLHSHFGRYPSSTKSVQIEPQALRFSLSSTAKKPEQIGLYSFFAMAGDFEVTAHYEWTPVAVPKDGYGVSCGIAIDTDTDTVALARGNFPGKEGGYMITTAKVVAGKKEFKNDEPLKTQAKRGRLVLRRQKKELICLTADGAGELTERCRIPITAGTVRQIRFFADPGDAPTNLDARLSKIHLSAEEITLDIPLSERGGWNWWLIGGIGFIAAAATFLLIQHIRKRRAADPQ